MMAGCSKTLVEQTKLNLNRLSSFGNLTKLLFGWVMFQPRFCKRFYRLVHIQSSLVVVWARKLHWVQFYVMRFLCSCNIFLLINILFLPFLTQGSARIYSLGFHL